MRSSNDCDAARTADVRNTEEVKMSKEAGEVLEFWFGSEGEPGYGEFPEE
jgi:hypothetical protein